MAKGAYEQARIAVDAVILAIRQGRLMVLLEQREKEPFRGMLELAGGLLLDEESAEHTLRRKLAGILGHEDFFITQFFTFTEPERDPRQRTISIGYICLSARASGGDGWHDVSKIGDLAFDHEKIVRKARIFLKENLTPRLAAHLLPQEFALNSLQEAYELIGGAEHDNRNFRKMMLAAGEVEETKKIEAGVSHRPAKLFRLAK